MSEGKEKFSVGMSKDKDHPWWTKDIAGALRPETRKMLEEYTGVPSEKLIEHIDKVRARAWEIGPYASVGQLTWLIPYITLHEAHDIILEKVKNGASILDCGCFFSTDLRHLAYEGSPTENMYGFDISPEFFDIGFDFYNDRDRFQGTFIAADGLEELDTSPLGNLKGKIDIIWSPKFLHIWNRSRQVEVAARLVALLKPQPGVMFVGSQNGQQQAAEYPLAPGSFKGQNTTFFLGSPDTIKEMWNEVAELTGTKWNVESRLLDLRTIGLHKDDGSEYRKRIGYNLQWTATLLEPAMAK